MSNGDYSVAEPSIRAGSPMTTHLPICPVVGRLSLPLRVSPATPGVAVNPAASRNSRRNGGEDVYGRTETDRVEVVGPNQLISGHSSWTGRAGPVFHRADSSEPEKGGVL